MDSKYTPKQVQSAIAQANFLLSSLSARQKDKFLDVLVAKFIADGDTEGIVHAMRTVQKNVK